MKNTFITQLNKDNSGKNIVIPKSDDTPISATEKLVREEIEKLTQNTEEIRKLKEQIDKKKEENLE